MLRKFVLTAAAAGMLGFAALVSAPAGAATINSATTILNSQIETDVTTVQHWRWGSRRYRRCVWVHTRTWSRWRCR
jgi:hypothetical protein